MVFARAPLAGRVKTRIARRIGDAAAANLHRRLVRGHSLGVSSGIGRAGPFRCIRHSRFILDRPRLAAFTFVRLLVLFGFNGRAVDDFRFEIVVVFIGRVHRFPALEP